MAKQNQESNDDFLKMQQEAIMRVREMQSRARATLENAGMHIENNDAPDFTSTKANIGRPQASAASQALSADEHSSTLHPGSSRPENTHQTSSHSGTARYDEPHSAAQRSFDNRPNSSHQNQRREEAHAALGENSDFLHMTGLNLSLDSDQLLLLATLYLLIKDGGDKWLILSLAYIMLI